jgi:hypothetical protein
MNPSPRNGCLPSPGEIERQSLEGWEAAAKVWALRLLAAPVAVVAIGGACAMIWAVSADDDWPSLLVQFIAILVWLSLEAVSVALRGRFLCWHLLISHFMRRSSTGKPLRADWLRRALLARLTGRRPR